MPGVQFFFTLCVCTQNAQSLMENSKMMVKQWLGLLSGHHVQGLNDLLQTISRCEQ